MVKFENYELSGEQRQLELAKHQRRMELRAQFLRAAADPSKHATNEGGNLFDPAIQRFHSMRVSHTEFFKPNPKTFRIGFFLVILPIFGFAQLFKWDKERHEKKYRTGEVSYRDRKNKFI